MKAPTWTRARLQRVLCLRFGFSAAGGVDTSAVAAEMGVTRRTVQRWLHASHGRSLAQIPPRRLEQLLGLCLPDAETRAQEEHQDGYARRAIANLGLPRQAGVKPAWKKQRWLELHVVAVIEVRVRNLRIYQLALGRSDFGAAESAGGEEVLGIPRPDRKLLSFTKRGKIVDHLSVPTRFHATVLSHRVLADLGEYRFAAGTDQVTQGYTKAWLADAPLVDLQETYTRVSSSLTDDPAAVT